MKSGAGDAGEGNEQRPMDACHLYQGGIKLRADVGGGLSLRILREEGRTLNLGDADETWCNHYGKKEFEKRGEGTSDG